MKPIARYHLINSLDKLEKLLGKKYRGIDRAAFSKEIFQHPLRFTDYLLKQIKKYPAIAKQYLPDPRELDPIGVERPLVGLIKTGVAGLERLYLDRVILMPTSQCFAYCRFCFRKNYSHDARKGDYGSPQDNFENAYNYIRRDPRIKEVLITGGDPLMFPKKVLEIVAKLRQIKHLTGIRIGSRIFTSDPKQITEEWVKPWKEMNAIETSAKVFFESFWRRAESRPKLREGQLEASVRRGGRLANPSRQKAFAETSINLQPVFFSPHINHPDELSPETIRSLLLCTQNNIPLYNQTVMLKGINDDPEILIDLFRKLRQLGVEPYRVYLADPLKGSEHFRVSIDRFMEIKRYLRAHASGRIVPGFIIDTRIGKIELGADSEIIKRRGRTVWIKTPYTVDIFRSMQRAWKVPDFCTVAKDENLIVEYEDARLKFTDLPTFSWPDVDPYTSEKIDDIVYGSPHGEIM